ncbi:MAG TPA: FtsX-like permease family protein [Candidatus Binatia bacterium]|nr:FtsX-like permease family protein [Candidatus Binatia bacterium]
MIRLLRLLSWRHFLRHRLRTALTFSGIALGVAVIVAIAAVNHTLVSSFQQTIETVAGKAVLQVTNGESGIRESLFPIIRDTEGVLDAVGAVEGFLPVSGFKGERLYIYGVDFLSDSSIREHEFSDQFGFDQALDFIAQPDSIALTESLSRRLDLALGSRISLATSQGVRSYTTRALLKERGAAKIFGGSFALMDLPVAQIALGKEGKIDVVDLTVEEGETVEAVKGRLSPRLQGAAQVARPKERGEQVESMLTSFRVGLFFVSLVALFVGFFLIYNTVAVSVIQRKREIGTLRCLGVVRSDILLLFVAEALALALPASLLGILTGLLLAQAALFSVGESVNNLFLQIDLTGVTLTLREFWIALASGMGVSLLAALFPAWQATQVSALEGARQTVWSPRTNGPRSASMLGWFLLLFFPAMLFLSRLGFGPVEKFTLGVVAMLIFLLGLSFLCPLFIASWVKIVGRGLFRPSFLSSVESRLASDSLYRSPVRSGITVATLMISLAAIFTIAAFVNSVRGSLLSWVDQMVTADLIVSSGSKTAGPMNVPLREDLATGMKAIPEVRVVDLYRLIRSTYEGKPILIESFSAQASAQVRKLPMAQGDGERALRGMAAAEGVIVSESFQSRFGKGMGDTIQLPTPSGTVPFRVLGVYVDYSSDSGSVLIDRAVYKHLWKDELVDAFDLWLSPAADQEAVIRKIKDDYGERYQLFVSTHRQLRAAVVDIMERSFRVNYAVEIIAVVVAIFSVVNTLLASVLDRTREIGVLRAIGATQSQVRKMVIAEAAWIGLMGGVLGLLSGTLMSYHHVVYNTKALTGWTFQYYYPLDVAFLCVVLAVGLCLAAGYLPAKQAASTPIVEAIGYE